MIISLSWLNDYLHTDLSAAQIAGALTSIGLEVEKIEQRDSVMGGLAGIIAGKVLTCEKHPDADRLSLTTVDVGKGEPASIVCGANNIAAGQMVWVALPETTLYDKSGKPWTIKTSNIRGALSEGMICAEDEMGLGDDHDGIIVLPDATVVGTKASDYYKVHTDTIFDIGLTPNRSDATSVLGVAEDLAAYLTIQNNKAYPVRWPEIPKVEPLHDRHVFPVTVKDIEACPRYSGVLIDHITIGPSPEWMQKRLQSIGVKTINNMVDITNFVLHEMGQPLHAFDADKIGGHGIMVETKPSGTPFLALDNETYTLYQEDLVICDATGDPMCIAGVYGGLYSGVSASTTSVFLESAHFNAGNVRRTSMRHNLRTDAARRFEKGSDPNITLTALARACDLITQYCGGRIASPIVDEYPQPVRPAEVTLRLARLNAITGIPFSMPEVQKLLKALRIDVKESDDHNCVIEIPTNKADVTREIDVIEEILRIYGFEKVRLTGKMQISMSAGEPNHMHRLKRFLGQYLASRGFLEAMNMSLTQPAFYKKLNAPDRENWVTIHNTSNESLNLMRPEMIIPTLEAVMRNVNRKQDDIRMFEFGKSYRQHLGVPLEKEHLVITLTGHQQPDHWSHGNRKPVDIFYLKSEAGSLLKRTGILQWHTRTFQHEDGFAYGIEYKTGASSLGKIGLVSPEWCEEFDIQEDIFILDFDLAVLSEHSKRSSTVYEELNRFPSVERDLAIVIGEHISFDQVQEVVTKAGGEWLTNVEVFDIYANPQHLGEGKKSVALRFTIENKESTMTDREIDQWFKRMQSALSDDLKAEIRK